MTAELRRGLFLAILGLVGGLGAVALLAGTGLLSPRQFTTAQVTPPAQPSPAPAPPAPPSAPAGQPPIAGSGPGAPQPAPVPTGQAEPKSSPPAGQAPSPATPAPPRAAAPPSTDQAARATPPQSVQAALGAVPQVTAPATAGPTFDVIRVEPDGSAVIAGRGAPGATVELLRGGEVFARGLADPSGLFALVPPPLPTGTSEITLRSGGPEGSRTVSRDSVLVVVAPRRDAKPLVALTSPEKPTVVLSRPDSEGAQAAATPATAPSTPTVGAPVAAAAAPPTAPQTAARVATTQTVKVLSVEAEEGGRLYVSAQAAPGATVRLYLNETLVAPGSVGADGRVAFAIGRGMRPGDYRVRVDQVDPVSGAVRARSEVPFAFPSALARAPAPAVAAAKPAATAGTPAADAALLAASPKPGARPAAMAKLDEMAGPADAAKPSATAKPAPMAKPIELAKPSEPAEPSAIAKATEPAKAPEPVKPGEAAKPAGAAKSPEMAKPAELAKPADVPAASPSVRVAAAPAGAAPPTPAATPAPQAPWAPPAIAVANPPSVPAARREARASAPEATVFVPQLETATVARGDNLWRISRRVYGQGVRFTVIYDANQLQIRDADLIYPGQVFVLPSTAADRQASGSR